MRYTVLGSGSSGNASLLEVDGQGLLIDAGLGPRTIAGQLQKAGAAWDHVHAVILTHTHNDHWRERTLAQMVSRDIPLYCHLAHASYLRIRSESFTRLENAGLLRTYAAADELLLFGMLRVTPFAICHDGGPTFGFRIERDGDLFERPWALGYATDLGTWDDAIVSHLADVDLLALEFNHDVNMERASGRHPHHIRRVLSDEGHLSNEQAAGLLRAILAACDPRRIRNVVQLHLSRQCNRPSLALAAALQTRDECGAAFQTHLGEPLFNSDRVGYSNIRNGSNVRTPLALDDP